MSHRRRGSVSLREILMDHFADWFSSVGGVLQTFLLVLLVVVWEVADPHADKHGFWLLYWLTVYSAVTQPVLAFSNAKAASSALRNEARMIRLERKVDKKIDLIAAHLGVDVSGNDY